MIRVFTDFQCLDLQGSMISLSINGERLESQVQALGIKIGDKVILGGYEDFELVGTLDYRFVDALGREAWVADADWSTRRDKKPE